MAPATGVSAEQRTQRSITRWSALDSEPLEVLAIERTDSEELGRHLGLRRDAASSLREALGSSGCARYTLAQRPELDDQATQRAWRTLIFVGDDRLAILDAQPPHGRIMSDRPFELEVVFAASALTPPRLVRVTVQWAGDPFVVEELLQPEDVDAGRVTVRFGEGQTLPAGATIFRVQLFAVTGAQARFRVTCMVLPTNPLALQLSPGGDHVTGTWSARAMRRGNAYDTGVNLTLVNGDDVAVQLRSDFEWRFWGGGVGTQIVEQGNGNFNVPVTVPGHGTWGGSLVFHSPRGSGIFGLFDSRRDTTIEIRMTTVGGLVVAGSITARTMFRFGVNITGVAGEDFTAQEWSDLFTAAAVTRSIYERRDLTFETDGRDIPRARVGSYEIITSYDQFHDLLSDWSGPDSNDNIDAFIVQTIQIRGNMADGLDGSVPGPTSHHGSDSGVVASKSGYIDADGQRRLHSEYLGMLIGHELGHYLGLEHVKTPGNLMLPSSGTSDTNLDYRQYKTMLQHGWVFID